MFRQLVTPSPPNGTAAQANVNSLFTYHPLQISAIVETVWRNRYNSAQSPFVPWPMDITNLLLADTNFLTGYKWSPAGVPTQVSQSLPSPVSGQPFTLPSQQPGIAGINPGTGFPTKWTNWDHLIWAYVVENTRIFDIFNKVLETYMWSEDLEVPSPASQLFLRNLEFLIYGDAIPSMIWTAGGRARKDEVANRLTVYYWMFGLDLSHAHELVGPHPYTKPAAANREFIPVFEEFGAKCGGASSMPRTSAGPTMPMPARSPLWQAGSTTC